MDGRDFEKVMAYFINYKYSPEKIENLEEDVLELIQAEKEALAARSVFLSASFTPAPLSLIALSFMFGLFYGVQSTTVFYKNSDFYSANLEVMTAQSPYLVPNNLKVNN